MGSLFSRFKVDIIANLPPELVLVIVSYLSVQEVLQCTLVCKRWNHIISHLAPFWINMALETAGLSKNTVSKSLKVFSSAKKFYFAALSQREEVRGLNLTPSHIRHPVPEEQLFTHCLDAREKCIVRTQRMLEEDGVRARHELVVEEMVGIPQVQDGIFTEQMACLPLEKQSRVIWAHVNGRLLYWVTATGLWKCYDLVSKEVVFTWKNHLIKEGKGVVAAKCKNCSMVALSTWSPASINDQQHQSTHTVQAIRLGDKTSSPVQLVQCKKVERKHCHKFYTELDSRYWIRSSFLLPGSQKKDDTCCSSHTLILQCDSSIMVHSLHTPSITDGEKSIEDLSVNFSKPTCLNCDYQLSPNTAANFSTRSINSEVKVSSDNTLMGQVYNMKLYVWEQKTASTQKDDKGFRLISSAPLARKPSGSCNSVQLVAVGHILSIVAFMDNGYLLDYKLQIMQTNTGQVLSEFRRIERFYNWSLCCQIDPLHKFYFMHEDERWLNDVRAKIPATPVTTLHNHHGKVHMEALQLRKTLNQTWRKHWRCAVNYSLRE